MGCIPPLATQADKRIVSRQGSCWRIAEHAVDQRNVECWHRLVQMIEGCELGDPCADGPETGDPVRDTMDIDGGSRRDVLKVRFAETAVASTA